MTRVRRIKTDFLSRLRGINQINYWWLRLRDIKQSSMLRSSINPWLSIQSVESVCQKTLYKKKCRRVGGHKKGEGRFSFTFLRREISPATPWAVFAAVYWDITLSYTISTRISKCISRNLCTLTKIRYASCLSWPTAHLLFLCTFHRARSSQPGKPLHIAVLRGSPGTRYIY